MMPGIDGIQTAKQLRENGIDSKIIFLTSLSDKMLEAFDVFAYHYIIKDAVSKEKFEEIARRKAYYHAPIEDAIVMKREIHER